MFDDLATHDPMLSPPSDLERTAAMTNIDTHGSQPTRRRSGLLPREQTRHDPLPMSRSAQVFAGRRSVIGLGGIYGEQVVGEAEYDFADGVAAEPG